MTTPTLKIKITPAPKLRGKMDVRFPANVEALSPIVLDKSGGNYTFSIDLDEVAANLPPSGVASVFGRIGVVTAQSGDYNFAQIGSTPTTLSGYGITDAQSLDSDLTAIAALTTTAYGRSLLTLANATALAAEVDSFFLTPAEGNAAYQPLDSDLTAIAALTTTSYGRAFLALADAAAARTAIGAVIGTNVQAWDADLDALAANATSGLWARTGAGTGAARTITGTANSVTVTNGNGVSGNPTLAISTDAALPGNPTTTTQAVDNSTTRIATTAYVVGQAAAATPLGNAATAVVGTSTRFARADHVHPGREVLTASRTYYFRSDGSDSNTGLVNSAGGAFLTIQKAIDTVAGLDCSIYDVTIQGGATGTYAPITLKTFLGAGKVTIVGDTTTPANYVISSTSSNGIDGSNVVGRYKVEGFKFTNATSGSHIKLYNTYCEVGANDYGAATTAHIWLEQNAYVEATANYTISGGASRHLFATTGGVFVCSAKTITLTGTPAFSSATIIASRTGVFNLPGNTYSGAATGTRYIISYNAVADVAGGGASYIPGNAAGSTSSGGQYA